MRATIPQTTLQKAGITTLTVGQLSVGPVQIGRLALDDFHLGLSVGTAVLTNFRVTLTLHLSLDWSVGVHIPFDGTPSWNGTIDLGSPSVTVPLHDVVVPGITNLDVDVQHLAAGPVTANATPLTNLTLGTAVAETIRAQNITLPGQGFSIAGLALNGAQLTDASVPTVSIGEIDVGRVHGEALPMGTLTLANVGLPAAAVNDVVSQGIDADAVGPTHDLHADAGVLELTLHITPEARGQIDQLTLSGVSASANIASIQLEDVVAPYELLNLKLSDIGIEQIAIPALGVS